MATEILMFTILYSMLAYFIIYPPIEFISSGLTIASVFAPFFGSENEQFVLYHIKLSILTLFVYSLLPAGYVIGLWIFNYEEISFLWSYDKPLLWQLFSSSCFIFPLLALYQIKNWSDNNWAEHPIAKNIAKFCNNNSSWLSVASDINIEFRSIDKICIQTNAITKVIATENWILKITPFMIFVAHQTDAVLEINQSDTHNLSPDNPGQVQYVNIEVKSSRENVLPFTIRLNALDVKDLQDRVARIITILPNVKFHKSLMDKFIDTFREWVMENPRYIYNQEVENCIGCMQTPANVKLQKICTDGEDRETCITCYCKPMWCIDCMARWFASRQDNNQPEMWLSSKCTCPMCRAKFCLLDVCLINED